MTTLVCCRRRRVTVSAAPAAVTTDIAGLVTESNAQRMEALEVRLGQASATIRAQARGSFAGRVQVSRTHWLPQAPWLAACYS